jgi:hypothetical protein
MARGTLRRDLRKLQETAIRLAALREPFGHPSFLEWLQSGPHGEKASAYYKNLVPKLNALIADGVHPSMAYVTVVLIPEHATFIAMVQDTLAAHIRSAAAG